MGCDGGCFAGRQELVKQKKPEARADTRALNMARWRTCALTGDALEEPIVACELGSLFNKAALIQAMLEKKMPAALSHIVRRSDLIDLHLTPNPAARAAVADASASAADSEMPWPFVCPITGHEANGTHRFVALRRCGHAISEAGLRGVASAARAVCPVCQREFCDDDVITLNGTAEDVALLRERMQRRKAAVQAARNARPAFATMPGTALPTQPAVRTAAAAATDTSAAAATNTSVASGAGTVVSARGIAGAHPAAGVGLRALPVRRPRNSDRPGVIDRDAAAVVDASIDATVGAVRRRLESERAVAIVPPHADPVVWKSLFARRDGRDRDGAPATAGEDTGDAKAANWRAMFGNAG